MDEKLHTKTLSSWMAGTLVVTLLCIYSSAISAQAVVYIKPPSAEEKRSFDAIKGNITDALRQMLSEGKYESLIKAAKPFEKFKDPDVQGIVKSAQAVIDRRELELRERIKAKKQENIKKILKKLKSVPVTEYSYNADLYRELLSYDPENKVYNRKYKYYKQQVIDNRMAGVWGYKFFNINIYRRKNRFYAVKTYRDGSKRKIELLYKKGETLEKDTLVVDGSVDGERYELTSTGYLFLYDREGLIAAGEPIYKEKSRERKHRELTSYQKKDKSKKAANLSDNVIAVSEMQFGHSWPLTVSRGYVECTSGNAAVFHHGGTRYQLNGAARMLGYTKIDSIWRNDPIIAGTKVSLWPLIKVALTTC